MRITARTRLLAVVGHPVRHSRSPAIHNAWLAHYGIDAVYLALDTPLPPRDPGDALRGLGVWGINVTVPHKGALFAAVDERDAAAEGTGAVNTVIVREDRLLGYNTDVEGFSRALAELGARATRHAIILGAGGAARAVARALLDRGAAVTLCNRTAAHARQATRVLGGGDIAPLSSQAFGRLVSTADLVVNTLPAAARQRVLALPTDGLAPHAAWVDLNYWDPDPPHLERLRDRGLQVQTGHAMLLHQGALAFARFTGVRPDLAIVRGALGP